MEFTIDEALQRGVTAHREGKLKQAEQLYRTILQSQPTHPDANHNLGLLAVAANNVGEALPLFKTALEANPKIEQFWFSYIEALIKNRELLNARQIIEQAKKRGCNGAKLAFIEAQAFSASQTENVDRLTPPEDQLDVVLALYNAQRINEAGTLAKTLTEKFPKHPFGWKILAAVLGQTGRHSEAVIAYQQVVLLSPYDAEIRNNLGVTLRELNRNEEAEASLTRAIAFKPDFAEAHFNLGYMLMELGRLEEAEACLRRTVAINPSYPQANNNLLKCLYSQDKRSGFFEKLDDLIKQGKANAVIGSFTSRAGLKYGIEKSNIFCSKPLEHVLHIDLNTQHDFEETFINKAKSILNGDRISPRKQSNIVNGYRNYGNLFNIEPDETGEIQKVLRFEIEKYLAYFNRSEEGLIKKWPNDYSLYGWLVSMRSGGEIHPHIHDQAWLSGSAYINVPPKTNADDGNLVVSLGRENDAKDNRLNDKNIINIVSGSLVLFPASLTHYTIPFKSEEERIVLAFDVIPK